MEYIVYISSATKLLKEEDLFDILAKSRKNNAERNLTGILLYGEGEKDNLFNLYQTIMNDPRHKNILKMAQGAITNRNFPDWSMGFRSMNSEELQTINGYIEPTQAAIASHVNDAPILTILKSFLNNNRMI